ncbi:SWFGD domain-containing protein, partial [Enterococcus hirae]
LMQVCEYMEVVGSDGEHVGTVDKVCGDRIILIKSDSDVGGVYYFIFFFWIKLVDVIKVTLEKSADEV